MHKNSNVCEAGVHLGENINTLTGSCFVDKMAVCLHFAQTNNIEWLFLHMSGNSQRTWKWLRQLGYVYCLHK